MRLPLGWHAMLEEIDVATVVGLADVLLERLLLGVLHAASRLNV
jgi:hypothetical protein